MILIATIIAVVVCAVMLWWAFEGDDEWRLDDRDSYESPLWDYDARKRR
jgi:hypothetical protein